VPPSVCLTYFDAATQSGTQFGTTTALGIRYQR